MFWDNNISKNIVYDTNIVEQARTSIATTAAKIETFFGIQLIMALIKMPQYPRLSRDKNYWGVFFT